ncbi:leucine-rich repeat protein SHOC-2-like [Cylas formicarius]|uniref:leucine-rich repeat protein SHOC-2-like n=1 Tax=Cylas formicarius TaxID=197179 RepID=UPI002958C6F8|nr:leucine-rich repeat protein SHOC-2-like [Cylas formicarius]
MFFPRTILLWFALLTTAKCDDDVVCDVDLVWYEAGKIEPHEYSAKSNVTDDLRNATKIEIAQNVSTLRYLELSFASDLKVLVVDNVGLTTIEPGALKSIPWTVENLTVTRNKMAAIPAGVFNDLGVKILNLSDNQIQTVKPDAFNRMTNLTTLVLDRNELVTYDLELSQCDRLSTISLRYNYIEELPRSSFKNLKDNAATVKLSFNKIGSVHDLAFDIKEFCEVHLDHNELTNARLLIKLIKADKVDLSENHIECLPKEFMENGLSKIKVLNLTNNPLNCSCLNDLKKKVRKNVEFQKMSPLVKNINIILPDKECPKK